MKPFNLLELQELDILAQHHHSPYDIKFKIVITKGKARNVFTKKSCQWVVDCWINVAHLQLCVLSPSNLTILTALFEAESEFASERL